MLAICFVVDLGLRKQGVLSLKVAASLLPSALSTGVLRGSKGFINIDSSSWWLKGIYFGEKVRPKQEFLFL